MGGLAVVLLGLLVGAVVAANYDVKNGRHNIAMGKRRWPPNYPLDTLLYHDSPKISGVWLPYPKVQSHDVCYPPRGSHPAPASITFFNVTDLMPGGEGGYAFVTKGGVGQTNLCLHLKTQRGKGYHFTVDVYGYYMYKP